MEGVPGLRDNLPLPPDEIRIECHRHRAGPGAPVHDPGGIGACSRWWSAARATPPDWGVENDPHPGGMPSNPLWSIEVPWIVGDTGFFEELDQFLAEGFGPVMFLLIGDVLVDGIPGRCTHSEGRVSLLPLETRTFRFANPRRRGFFNSRMKSERQAVGLSETSRWT